MTRALQNRLALANVKIQHGWENLSIEAIEPRIEEQLKRKRPASSVDTISDTSSIVSDRLLSSSGGLCSSPLTAPMFSDDFQRSGSSQGFKRPRQVDIKLLAAGSQTGRRTRLTSKESWKKTHHLPESSPVHHTKHARFSSSHVSHLSFASATSTIPDDSPSPELSEEDDADLPVHSFNVNASRIHSSPPCTPPPGRRLRHKAANNVSWSRTPKTGEEGADLLLYLATSPSPAHPSRGKTVIQPPSTPPCKPTPLPSSHMTPGTGGAGFLGFGPNTPSTNFNFADFVNVTPSPAQGAWSRTPAAGKTPIAAREARRKLNFDALLPPTSSPNLSRTSGNQSGLGMELGGELVS